MYVKTLCVPPGTHILRYQVSFAEGSWTDWFDRDNPVGADVWTLGDDEGIDNEAVHPCGGAAPLDAICENANGLSSELTGQNLTIPCGVEGLKCSNADNPPDGCDDYRVKYRCPSRGRHEIPRRTATRCKPFHMQQAWIFACIQGRRNSVCTPADTHMHLTFTCPLARALVSGLVRWSHLWQLGYLQYARRKLCVPRRP